MVEQSIDDFLADALAEYQQCRDTGQAAEWTELHHAAELPDEVRARIERGKACIDMLVGLREERKENRITASLSRVADSRREIGGFQIIEEIGSGGFGIVHRALDPMTRREVALKIPRIEVLASDEMRQRFEQEAHAAARFDHKNVVPVLEAGIDGLVPYIATPYYSGITLAVWLSRHREPIPPRDVARLMVSIAEGIEHAHDRGVLHRDLKPSNVLLVDAGGTLDLKQAKSPAPLGAWVPKIIDFGLAKLSDGTKGFTQSGALLGTIRYMAPEQATGHNKVTGPATDIYGLGAILYELLAAEPPFASSSDFEALRKIETDEPSRMSIRNRRVPRDLETICFKCLEKNPWKRYLTAAELAADLNRYLDGKPILARRSTPWEHLLKWCRRNPYQASLIGFIAIAALAFVSVLMYSNAKLTDALITVDEQRIRAEQSELAARRYAYGSDMRRAQEAWESSIAGVGRDLLRKYIPTAGEADLRGFEWHYLWDMMHNSSQVVATQPNEVWSMAVSPDSNHLATGDRYGKIRLWRLGSDSEPRSLTGHADGDVDCLTFLPESNSLVSAANDHTIRVWDLATGALQKTLQDHQDWIGAMGVSSDRKHLATGDGQGRILLWTLPAMKLKGELYRHADAVRWIVFHPEKPCLFSACEGGEVRVWDYIANAPPPEAPLGKIEAPPNVSWRHAVVDREHVWASSRHRLIRWDITNRDNWHVIGREFDNHDKIMSLALLGLGRLLLTAHEKDFEIALRQITNPEKVVQTFRGHESPVRCLSTTSADNVFFSGSEDGTVRRWNLGLTESFTDRVTVSDRPLTTSWSPIGTSVAIGLFDGTVGLIGDVTKPEFSPIAKMSGPVNGICWFRNGKRFWAATEKGEVACYDGASKKNLLALDTGTSISKVLFDESENRLILLHHPNLISAVDAASGRELWRYEVPGEGHYGIRWSTNEEVMVWFASGHVRCFDTKTGKITRELRRYPLEVCHVDQSADRRWLALAAGDKTIHILDAKTFEESKSFPLAGKPESVFFCDHDRRLLAFLVDQLVVIDIETGQITLRLSGFNGQAASMNSSRSSLTIGSGNEVHFLRLDLQDQNLKSSALKIEMPLPVENK